MPPTLLHFLATLATDQRLMEQFIRNPKEAMQNFGLSDHDVSLVLDKNPEEIEEAVRIPVTHSPVVGTVVYVPIVYSAYPPIPVPWPVTHFTTPYGTPFAPPPMNIPVTHFTAPVAVYSVPPMNIPVTHFTAPTAPAAPTEAHGPLPGRPKTPPTH
jgi:hypothetical protein